jgi:hypothetical protein
MRALQRRLLVGSFALFFVALLPPANAAQGISWKSSSTATLCGGCGQSISIPLPAGAAAGDVLVATVVIGNSGNGAQPAWTDPAGWILAGRLLVRPAHSLAFATHVVGTGEPASYTWSWNLWEGGIAWISDYAGVNPTAPINAAASADLPSGSSFAAPSVTATVPGTMVLAAFGGYWSGGTGAESWSLAPPLTARVNTTNGSSRNAAGGDAPQATAGATPAPSATTSVSLSYAMGFTIALAPAAAQVAIPNDFSIALNPVNSTVRQNGTATVTVQTSLTSGQAQSISLSAAGLPAGVTASFSPAAVTAGSTSTMTLTAAAGAPAITLAPYTVTGSAASGSRSAAGNVTVQASAASASSPIRNVFVIVMENANWASFKGNPSAPYLNNTLLPAAAHAEQYYNPPGNHPSLPNYLWMEAGSSLGIVDDNPPSINHQTTTQHLAAQLNTAGVPWKAYLEDISGSGCPTTDVGRYAAKHNPFVYFDDITGGVNPLDPFCAAHNRPYGELATDLSNNLAVRYNFIVPNLCNDGHDSCPPLYNTVAQTDTWLSNEVPRILASAAYKNGGAIFITWDEGISGDGPIGMIVLSALAKAGYQNSISYNHSSLLATVSKIFGVTPLRNAATATDLSDLFTVPIQ